MKKLINFEFNVEMLTYDYLKKFLKIKKLKN